MGVEQRGKNLFDPLTLERPQLYTVDSDGGITVKGSDGYAWKNVSVSCHLPAGQYVFSKSDTLGYCAIRTSENNFGSDKVVLYALDTTSGLFKNAPHPNAPNTSVSAPLYAATVSI